MKNSSKTTLLLLLGFWRWAEKKIVLIDREISLQTHLLYIYTPRLRLLIGHDTNPLQRLTLNRKAYNTNPRTLQHLPKLPCSIKDSPNRSAAHTRHSPCVARFIDFNQSCPIQNASAWLHRLPTCNGHFAKIKCQHMPPNFRIKYVCSKIP